LNQIKSIPSKRGRSSKDKKKSKATRVTLKNSKKKSHKKWENTLDDETKKKTLSQPNLTLITCDLRYEIEITSQKEKQNKPHC
jgi:hypothetical protein